MTARLRILLVDDDLGDARQIARAIRLSRLQADCIHVTDVDAAFAACAELPCDCAIVDYQLPGQDGLQALLAFGECLPDMPLVMSTGHGDEIVATEAMKRGASDYIRKGDITPSSIRRVIENAVEKVELRRKLAEQRKELERFAEVLVHDLRAPSSSIQTFVTYLQEDLSEGKMDMISQYCDFAIKAASRMDILIATLFQYTRLDGEVSFEHVDMQEVLEDALANLHTTLRTRCAVVTHSQLPTVIGNRAQLAQLVQNLIGNGIKYCRRPAPTVHIESRLEENGMWIFSVTDNGIGIPEKDQRRIFESFTRLHGIGEFEGTGLGLATCTKIVARHGGTITCESSEGVGSTFSFTLRPARELESAAEASLAA